MSFGGRLSGVNLWRVGISTARNSFPGTISASTLAAAALARFGRPQAPVECKSRSRRSMTWDRKKGGRELRALRLLKNIRHPNLVPLLGFWLLDAEGNLLADDGEQLPPESTKGTMALGEQPVANLGTGGRGLSKLIIAMGLCERSLTDRLEACLVDGLPAVPFAELLTYMEDTARAIDLLNTKHDIQHCDIKPQNLLLLSGAAQVADFGLAKMIGDVRESSMGAGTIAYGAPEVLLGNGPSHATDQYSLAISYFELRTAQLPFGTERISEVLAAKQDGTIDLNALPPGEREVIVRATSIAPEDRYPSCVEMVRALREHGSPDGSIGVVGDTEDGRADRTVRLSNGPQNAGKLPWSLVAAVSTVVVCAGLFFPLQ